MTKHDEHYKALDPHEPRAVIKTWVKANEALFRDDIDMVYDYGNAIKYLGRVGLKGNPVKDLEKAIDYISRLIEGIKETEKKDVDWENFILSELKDDECCEGFQEAPSSDLNVVKFSGACLYNTDPANENPDYTNITADCNIRADRAKSEGVVRPVERILSFTVEVAVDTNLVYHKSCVSFPWTYCVFGEDGFFFSEVHVKAKSQTVHKILDMDFLLKKGTVLSLAGELRQEEKILYIDEENPLHKFEIL